MKVEPRQQTSWEVQQKAWLAAMTEKYQADPNGVQILSATAVQTYDEEVSRWVSQHPSTRPSSMMQPIWPEDVHKACHSGDIKTVKAMILGPDGIVRTATPDRYGRTPLHIAAIKGRVDIIKVLLDVWTSKEDKQKVASRKTKDGFTAADWAEINEHHDALEVLMVHTFGHTSHVVRDCELKYNLKRGPGFIPKVYEILKIQNKIEADFNMTEDQIQDFIGRNGIAVNKKDDLHRVSAKLEQRYGSLKSWNQQVQQVASFGRSATSSPKLGRSSTGDSFGANPSAPPLVRQTTSGPTNSMAPGGADTKSLKIQKQKSRG
eukprot:CAMPEP_0184288292 /NCGR_PEP_ID=MMETSP1049-20130417/810_1 /TAXON_ID=77928 /ORGANISM="Proteomonas sulcata, Strain CCMP704" /LENGTH=318 /DNA_ID=CAMNT_0026594603 /DNA_START=385 /DNA_END=1341 /DNA_ORIENTATION=-